MIVSRPRGQCTKGCPPTFETTRLPVWVTCTYKLLWMKWKMQSPRCLEKPILVGHSVGGLIVQLLVQKGLAEMGVPIDSVAPNAMLAFDWGFMKNSALIANPFKGNDPFMMDVESFHGSFCNTMSMEETEIAYNETATHDSRNVLRDCMGEPGQLDLELPHAPLLFIAGEEDEIIPYELSQRNAEAYTDEVSISDFKAFPGRGHFICGEPGWEEVADYISEWLQAHSEQQVNTSSAVL